MMEEHENPVPTPIAAPKRRRRRSGGMVEPVLPATEVPAPGRTGERTRTSAWGHWARKASYFGVFSAFRAYLFVGGVIAILAFLLYNESLIQEFEKEKKNQVELYANLYTFAYSQLATNEQMGLIFTEVIEKPSYFPIIFTNYKGEITEWKGEGLPAAGDTSKASIQLLRELVQKMDAQNEPIPFEASPQSRGLLHYDQGNFILSNSAGDIAGWRGSDLPAEDDTTATTVVKLREALARMDARNEPHDFFVAHKSFSYLHGDGESFVITDNRGEIVEWQGASLPEQGERTPAVLEQIRQWIQRQSAEKDPYPFKIPSETLQYIHYGDSDLVSRVSWANFALVGVLLLFSLVGYIGFRNIRRSEQRSIWVGMAKETAHQLGTPLSSLSGWLELIRHELEKVSGEDGPARLQSVDQKVGEMQKDMQRLNQIASRFSQIGSVPELKMEDITAVLEETINYFKSRGPQFGQCDIRVHCREVPLIPLNAELMSWAFENLFKNGMDAIGRKAGAIEIRLGLLPSKNVVQIAFQDNGRGIEPENVNRVFEPGFSTKKRGWGLGLAFVKRIVEEYHKGRISIIQSMPGKGTTFEVILPVA